MNKLFIVLVGALLTTSCNPTTKNNPGEPEDNAIDKKETNTLPNFKSMAEMFAYTGDFSEEDGSLRFVPNSKNEIHVQVSKPIFKDDLESVKKKIVKGDIVYVLFQAFALTNIDQLTISSVPMDFENNQVKYEEYEKTVTISRDKAEMLLEKYLNSNDLSILFGLNSGIWLPSKKFDMLRYDFLEDVYEDLEK